MVRRITVSLVLSWHLSILGEDIGKTAFEASVCYTDVTQEGASEFGHLKFLLSAISAAYADREVRPQFFVRKHTFTNHSTGIRLRQEQGRRAALTRGLARHTFCDTPGRRSRTQAQG